MNDEALTTAALILLLAMLLLWMTSCAVPGVDQHEKNHSYNPNYDYTHQ